jgi:hypothetical protein
MGVAASVTTADASTPRPRRALRSSDETKKEDGKGPDGLYYDHDFPPTDSSLYLTEDKVRTSRKVRHIIYIRIIERTGGHGRPEVSVVCMVQSGVSWPSSIVWKRACQAKGLPQKVSVHQPHR